jgi:hypothetical protein
MAARTEGPCDSGVGEGKEEGGHLGAASRHVSRARLCSPQGQRSPCPQPQILLLRGRGPGNPRLEVASPDVLSRVMSVCRTGKWAWVGVFCRPTAFLPAVGTCRHTLQSPESRVRLPKDRRDSGAPRPHTASPWRIRACADLLQACSGPSSAPVARATKATGTVPARSHSRRGTGQ